MFELFQYINQIFHKIERHKEMFQKAIWQTILRRSKRCFYYYVIVFDAQKDKKIVEHANFFGLFFSVIFSVEKHHKSKRIKKKKK